jgi:hypothetical protein
MRLVDREIVQELIQSSDPDATLVFTHGNCVVVRGAQAADPGGLVITRRRDIAAYVADEGMTDERLDFLACCLDNAVRDLGG